MRLAITMSRVLTQAEVTKLINIHDHAPLLGYQQPRWSHKRVLRSSFTPTPLTSLRYSPSTTQPFFSVTAGAGHVASGTTGLQKDEVYR